MAIFSTQIFYITSPGCSPELEVTNIFYNLQPIILEVHRVRFLKTLYTKIFTFYNILRLSRLLKHGRVAWPGQSYLLFVKKNLH